MNHLSYLKAEELLTERCPELKLLVLGDLMLDHWVWGAVTRISPEAPIPIVDVERYTYTPGGAANVVNNLRMLGCTVSVAGVVGADDGGRRLRALLRRMGVDTSGVIRDPQRPTTLKTRIVAHNQQVVRADYESRMPLDAEIQTQLLDWISPRLSEFQAVLVSDYNKGLFNESFVSQLLGLFWEHNSLVVVGPKPENFKLFAGVELLTLNAKEATATSGLPTNNHEEVLTAGKRLQQMAHGSAIVVTRGEHGMSLFPRSHDQPYHMPALASQVYDVSGAGDTVLSAIGLVMAGGFPPQAAIELASHAAAVVVRKVGTATATAGEILSSLEENRWLTQRARRAGTFKRR